MVDRFIDVKEEQGGVISLQKFALAEIEDATTVDKEKESDLLVHLGFLNAGKQLCVPGDRVDLILYIFAFEKFLCGG